MDDRNWLTFNKATIEKILAPTHSAGHWAIVSLLVPCIICTRNRKIKQTKIKNRENKKSLDLKNGLKNVSNRTIRRQESFRCRLFQSFSWIKKLVPILLRIFGTYFGTFYIYSIMYVLIFPRISIFSQFDSSAEERCDGWCNSKKKLMWTLYKNI